MTQTEALSQRRDQLLQKLAALQPFRHGSLNEMFRKCGKSNCHCARDDHPGHGPTWVWSRHLDRRTRSVTLPESEIPQVRREIAEYQHFRELCRELAEVNTQWCEVRRKEREPGEPEKGGVLSKRSKPRRSRN